MLIFHSCIYSDKHLRGELVFTAVVRASPIDTLRESGTDQTTNYLGTLLTNTPSSTRQFDPIPAGSRPRFSKMRFSAATLVAALGWITATTAHTIQLKAHSRECFHESLHRDDLMTVTFQVGDREFGGSGNLEIDFWVCLRSMAVVSPGASSMRSGDSESLGRERFRRGRGQWGDFPVKPVLMHVPLQVEDPLRNRQYYKQAISNEDYSFTAHADGKYTYCFSNEGWTSNSKEVSFNVHGIVYVSEAEMSQDPLETEGKNLREREREGKRNTHSDVFKGAWG